MVGGTASGLTLTLLAGAMSGNCMLPMKFVQRWRWENIWLVFSLLSLFVLPWTLALVLVRDLFGVYSHISADVYGVPLIFGAGWGIAQILFGISVRRLGMGLGYAIIVGLGAVLGTLVPLFVGQRRFVSNEAVLFVVLGVVVMALGIALMTWGGKLIERTTKLSSGTEQSSGYTAAVLLAVLCGFMAPMLNYAFAFGQRLADAAVSLGNTPVRAAYAVWPIALLGGLIPNAFYSLVLVRKNDSWRLFGSRPIDGSWPVLMAILWMGAFALYGMSSVYIGALGTSVGWALFQIFMILAATLSGVLTGEWKRATGTARALLYGGIAFLIGATVLLAFGSR